MYAESKGGTWEFDLEAFKTLIQKETSIRHILIKLIIFFTFVLRRVEHGAYIFNHSGGTAPKVNTHCFSVDHGTHSNVQFLVTRESLDASFDRRMAIPLAGLPDLLRQKRFMIIRHATAEAHCEPDVRRNPHCLKVPQTLRDNAQLLRRESPYNRWSCSRIN